MPRNVVLKIILKSFLFSIPKYDCIKYETYTKVAYSIKDEEQKDVYFQSNIQIPNFFLI